MFKEHLENLNHEKIIISAILFIILVLIRYFIIKLISNSKMNLKSKRRWIVLSRNIQVIMFILLIIFIWFEQLKIILTSLTVIAVAFVIATKELILNIIGFFFRSGINFFKIGDRIEIDDTKGDVIDESFLGIQLLEINPQTNQYSGKTIFVPNQKLLTGNLTNQNLLQHYAFHTITIPLKITDNWLKAEKLLIDIANQIVMPYLEEIKTLMAEIISKHSLDAPTAEPRVHFNIVNSDNINLVLRLPIPIHRRGRIEQTILRNFLTQWQEIKNNS